MTDADRDTVNAMIVYGGGFVQALGRAFERADASNFERLRSAFPEYWGRYSALAEKRKAVV